LGVSGKKWWKARTKANQVVNGAGGAEVVLAHGLTDGCV